MIAVRLAEGPEFAIEDRQVLFSTEGFGPPYEQHAMYGLAPDGRFIMVRPLAEAVGGVELVVIENFHQVLRARFDG